MVIIAVGIILFCAYFFDKALFAGLIFVGLLVALTIYLLYKFKLLDKPVCFLFLIALVVHLAMGLFIYYANFQPFGGGDFIIYQDIAEQVSQRIHAEMERVRTLQPRYAASARSKERGHGPEKQIAGGRLVARRDSASGPRRRAA